MVSFFFFFFFNVILLSYLKKKSLFIYFETEGKGGEKEREKHQCVVASHMCTQLGTWPTTQACALTGN